MIYTWKQELAPLHLTNTTFHSITKGKSIRVLTDQTLINVRTYLQKEQNGIDASKVWTQKWDFFVGLKLRYFKKSNLITRYDL